MCGIAGYLVRRGQASADIVGSQLALLDHRGPDARGVFSRGKGAIGQTRLSIIDLETGDPPLSNEDDSIGCVLNGEIYNFQGLREQLLGSGHALRTTGDTEILCHLAEEMTAGALATALHGMFAYAIWDEPSEVLTLGRDRLGEKPLYYWTDGMTFAFASEIKALLVHPAVPKRLDCGVIPAYLTFGYVPTPRTFFEGIQSVPPGHTLTVNSELRITINQYWKPRIRNLDEPSPRLLSRKEIARDVRGHLQSAVEKRLISDVPLGAFLSGGVDSSSIVAAMTRASSLPVRTFTIGFENAPEFDERHYARLVAERFQTEHTELVVRPDSVDLIERLVWHHDQPFGDSSAIPTFLLSEMTSEHVKVSLAGDGGDELFAGYWRFAAGLALARMEGLPSAVREATLETMRVGARLGSSKTRNRLGRFSDQARSSMPDGYREWISYVPELLRDRLAGSTTDWATEAYRQVWRQSEGGDTLDRLLELNMRTYLLDDLLPKVDRMSMAHGLEVRAPFLDHDFVDFALLLPRRARIAGWTLKRALKDAMGAELPREIIMRPKQGFGVPLRAWFREDLNAYLQARLGSSDASIRRFLDGDTIAQVINEHLSDHSDHVHTLWTLLTLEVFLRAHDW